MGIRGTRTEKNLLAAFAGESQARNRYTYFAGQAKKDGHVRIAQVFEETAEHEKEHAKRFFKLLEGGELEITATFPAGVIGTTAQNLEAAAGGEEHEWTTMYPAFAAEARREGLEAIALVFEHVAVAEKYHWNRYRDLLKNLQAGTIFRKNEPVVWRCINCGFLWEGPAAPAACPACAHPQAYFEVVGGSR
jgi:rubrerythrin